MVEDQKGERCVKAGTGFSGQVSQNSQFRGNGDLLCLEKQDQEKDNAHTDQLFCDLGRGRNPGPLHTIIVAIDAGVDG